MAIILIAVAVLFYCCPCKNSGMEEEDPEFYKSFASYTQNDISQIDFVIQNLQFRQKGLKHAYEFFPFKSLIPLGKELFPLISNTLKNAAESGNSFCDNVKPPWYVIHYTFKDGKSLCVGLYTDFIHIYTQEVNPPEIYAVPEGSLKKLFRMEDSYLPIFQKFHSVANPYSTIGKYPGTSKTIEQFLKEKIEREQREMQIEKEKIGELPEE